jgi:tetratricopeptide (TPR) repeat protein
MLVQAYHEACTNMGGAYSKLKKYRKAIKAYEKAIKIKPGYYEAHYSMGLAYIKLFELQLIQSPYCNKPHDNQA